MRKQDLFALKSAGSAVLRLLKNIEASVFEMMLPAIELWERGEAENYIGKFEKFDPE